MGILSVSYSFLSVGTFDETRKTQGVLQMKRIPECVRLRQGLRVEITKTNVGSSETHFCFCRSRKDWP